MPSSALRSELDHAFFAFGLARRNMSARDKHSSTHIHTDAHVSTQCPRTSMGLEKHALLSALWYSLRPRAMVACVARWVPVNDR